MGIIGLPCPHSDYIHLYQSSGTKLICTVWFVPAHRSRVCPKSNGRWHHLHHSGKCGALFDTNQGGMVYSLIHHWILWMISIHIGYIMSSCNRYQTIIYIYNIQWHNTLTYWWAVVINTLWFISGFYWGYMIPWKFKVISFNRYKPGITSGFSKQVG